MLTVVALEAESAELGQAPAVAAALAALARRQEVAVVCECGTCAEPHALTRELRAALPEFRVIGVRAGAEAGAEVELIGQLLERGALPVILVPEGGTATAATTLADKLSASALLRLVEPTLAGWGSRSRRRSQVTARLPVER